MFYKTAVVCADRPVAAAGRYIIVIRKPAWPKRSAGLAGHRFVRSGPRWRAGKGRRREHKMQYTAFWQGRGCWRGPYR